MNSAKTVFVSYAWSDPEVDKNWIHDFVVHLRNNGVDATFDEFELQEKAPDLSNMMLDSFYNSDYIIPVLTKHYANKANKNEGGVGFEKILTTRLILDKKLFSKVLPIKKSKDTENCIPNHLDKLEFIDFSDDENFDQSLEDLLYRILDVPKYEKNPVKTARKLPTRKSQVTERNSVQKEGYGYLIKKHLEDLGYSLAHLSEEYFQNTNTVIYPVVPRNKLTIIHQSQLEIIRFLISNCGWNCHILITNCGSEFIHGTDRSEKFYSELHKYCKKRNIDISKIEFSFLNDYFFENRNTQNHKREILNGFVDISTELTMKSLQVLNEKDYAEHIKYSKRNQPLIDTLRPVLTLSVTKLLCKITENDNKPIILAGVDEEKQWTTLFKKIDVGAILNPILEVKDEDVSHDDLLFIWTEKSFRDRLENGNFYYWTFASFVALHFNELPIDIFKGDKSNNLILDSLRQLEKTGNSENIIKNRFSKYVYNLINMG